MQNKMFYILVALIVIVGIVWIQSGTNPTKNTDIQNIPMQFTKGSNEATVTVKQYSDFLCPSCSQVSVQVIPDITKNYINTNKIRYEFIPMAFIAPGSETAAEGAFCAAKENKFWEYHDAAYIAVWSGYFSKGVDPSRVPLYSKEGVKAIGASIGVDKSSFDACIDNGDQKDEVITVTKEAQANGITGTPYFTVNDVPIKGVPDYQILDAAIKAQL